MEEGPPTKQAEYKQYLQLLAERNVLRKRIQVRDASVRVELRAPRTRARPPTGRPAKRAAARRPPTRRARAVCPPARPARAPPVVARSPPRRSARARRSKSSSSARPASTST
jgi:hypothetical protein